MTRLTSHWETGPMKLPQLGIWNRGGLVCLLLAFGLLAAAADEPKKPADKPKSAEKAKAGDKKADEKAADEKKADDKKGDDKKGDEKPEKEIVVPAPSGG